MGQAQSTQRQQVDVSGDEGRLVARIITLAIRYGRYGYRRITALLRAVECLVNHLSIERIWRIDPGSPWENGDIESFKRKLRGKLLNLEIATTLFEAQVLIER